MDCYRTQSKKRNVQTIRCNSVTQRKSSKEWDECWSVYRFISCYSLKERGFSGFFSTYDNTTEGIKQTFEQTYYMIYGSIKNALAIGITGRKKIRSGQPNCTFLSRRSSKRKNEMPLKVSDVMINARGGVINSVVLFFTKFISMVKN